MEILLNIIGVVKSTRTLDCTGIGETEKKNYMSMQGDDATNFF